MAETKAFEIRIQLTADDIGEATLELYIQSLLERGSLKVEVATVEAYEKV